MSKGSINGKKYFPLTMLADGERLEIGRVIFNEKRERIEAHFDVAVGAGSDLAVLSFAMRENLFDAFALVPIPKKAEVWTIHLPSVEEHEDDGMYTLCEEQPWQQPDEGVDYVFEACELCQSMAALMQEVVMDTPAPPLPERPKKTRTRKPKEN